MSVICTDNPMLTEFPGEGESPRKLTGFALPGYASRAGRKGQAMGLCRRWTREEARAHASAAGKASVAARRAKFGTGQPVALDDAGPRPVTDGRKRRRGPS